MKIVIATPLYPPEIAEPAPYTKELARRLSKNHTVTVVAYARIPEKVPGVHIIAVNKRWPRLVRLLAYTHALWRAKHNADVIYAINGPSVEFPILLVSFVSRAPFFFAIADHTAHERAGKKLLSRILEQRILAHARGVMQKLPLPKPEILPLEDRPVEAETAYEESWRAHLEMLHTIFNHD